MAERSALLMRGSSSPLEVLCRSSRDVGSPTDPPLTFCANSGAALQSSKAMSHARANRPVRRSLVVFFMFIIICFLSSLSVVPRPKAVGTARCIRYW